MPQRLTVADAAVAMHADWAAFQREMASEGTSQAATGGKTMGDKFKAAFNPAGISKAFTAAGAVGGALFVGAIGGAVNFEDQLRTINTVAHLTDGELKGVGDSILDLSKETGKSTDDLTAGFYDLVSAGVPAKDAINVLRDSAKFATGALGTTGEAVDLVTSAMNAYGLSAKDSTRITDVFAQAVADGKTTAAALGASIANIAPIASSAGISLEEVGAGFGLLTKNGVPAAQAATQMRAAISALLTPNAQLNELQQQTGINFAELAKEKGLAVALEAIRKATNGNDDAFAKALGSIEGYQFALASTGDNAGQFADELGRVETASRDGGVAQGMYTEQMKSAKKQGDIWLANLKALGIQIGGPFTSVLGPAVSVLGSMGQGLGGIFRISTLVGSGIGALTGRAIPALVRGLLLMKVSALSTIPALFATGGALNFMLGPIGIIIAVVGALFLAWQTNFLGIRDIVGAVVGFISEHLGFLLGPIKVVADAVGALFGFIGDVVHNVGDAITGGGDDAVAAADTVVANVDTTIHEAGDKWGASATDAAMQIPTGIDKAGKPTYDAAAAVADQIPAAIADVAPEVKELASKVALDLAGGLRKKRSDIDAAMQQLTDDIKNRMTEAKERVHLIALLTGDELVKGLHSKDPVVKAQAEGTKTLILERLDELGPGSGKAGKAAQAALKKALHDKDPEVRAQARLTKEHIEDELNAIKAKAAGEKAAKALAQSIANWIRGPGRAIIGGAVDFIEGLFGNVGVTAGAGSAGGMRHHALGSAYIPADEIAVVHKGERILTATENAAISRGEASLGIGAGGVTYNITANIEATPQARDPFAIAQELRRFAELGVLEPAAARDGW